MKIPATPQYTDKDIRNALDLAHDMPFLTRYSRKTHGISIGKRSAAANTPWILFISGCS